jgi:uncharacterized protein (TIGR02145 family)
LSLPEPFLTIIIYLKFFHMRKVFFLMLTLLIWSVASMNAQVRIGGLDDPNTSAVLDLNATDTANNGALGLALPRVTLQSTDDESTITEPVAGLAVYNTANAGTGATAVVPGIYVFTGIAWALQAPPVIITQPKSFSWSRLYEEEGDPYGPATVTTIADLTVEASGAGLTYQWYKKAVNRNVADTLLTSETSNTYTPVVTAWGMNSYYCVVSNAYGSVKSDVADVAAGCGAKTVSGGWLKFMCYNLGGKKGADPFVFNANDSTNLGKFYQWGRPDSIARTAVAPANFIAAPAYPYDWTIPEGYNTDKPFNSSYHQDDYLWRNHKNGDYDPCPAGWHVPSQSAFAAIFKGTADADVPGNATANTWTPTGTWTWTSASSYGNGGYAVKPDGVTTTLFFPAAGHRYYITGTLFDAGLYGNYWGSTAGATGAFALGFNSARVYPAHIRYRVHGFSVRCVSE